MMSPNFDRKDSDCHPLLAKYPGHGLPPSPGPPSGSKGLREDLGPPPPLHPHPQHQLHLAAQHHHSSTTVAAATTPTPASHLHHPALGLQPHANSFLKQEVPGGAGHPDDRTGMDPGCYGGVNNGDDGARLPASTATSSSLLTPSLACAEAAVVAAAARQQAHLALPTGSAVADGAASSSDPAAADKAALGRFPETAGGLAAGAMNTCGQSSDSHHQSRHEQDKRSIYKHPLFPLLALLFEKCELATQSPECPTSESFNMDIQTFIQHQQRDKKPFFTEDEEVNDLMIRAIQVLRIHLLELEKVQELCKDFCNRYITCLKGKMQSENLLRSEYGGYESDEGSSHGHHQYYPHHYNAPF